MLLPVSERAHVRCANHAPAANTDAVVTIAADSDQCWVIKGIQYSYLGAAPTNGSLTVVVGSTTLLTVGIKNEGYGDIDIPAEGLARHVLNEAVTITLAAGGASCTGKLNVQYA